uniref:SAGE_M_99 n=1 Tax=Drosophila pseudoobscura TaxID=7237 RepID=B3TQE4_9MUSC|nr:SAGE_M_99 [Drosophila pseudoobscura]ACB14992.1 SAGE_M_99 [Drosophila pseudoobscura]ACB14993.1 SAGE_M_99 [Drosophila pseudoobscura]
MRVFLILFLIAMVLDEIKFDKKVKIKIKS